MIEMNLSWGDEAVGRLSLSHYGLFIQSLFHAVAHVKLHCQSWFLLDQALNTAVSMGDRKLPASTFDWHESPKPPPFNLFSGLQDLKDHRRDSVNNFLNGRGLIAGFPQIRKLGPLVVPVLETPV
jgi:hypothetical protein